MGKQILAILLAAVLLISVACSSDKLTLDTAKTADNILSELTFNDQLNEVTADSIGNYYPGLTGVAEEYKVYISGTGLTTEEIVVAKTKGSSTADLKKELEKRVAEQKFRYQDYLPAQVKKLDDAVLQTKGDYAILIVSEDADAAAALVKEILK